MGVTNVIKAVAAGLSIGIGGHAFLSLGGGVLGALFFSVGLLCVCIFCLNLFTGKVCYCVDKEHNMVFYIVILLVNLVIAWVYGIAARFMNPEIVDYAKDVTADKLSKNFVQLAIAAIVCNILIYIAVETFKIHRDVIGVITLVLCISTFIIVGAEHCIANSFYFAVAKHYDTQTLVFLLINIAFNIVGGILGRVIYGHIICEPVFSLSLDEHDDEDEENNEEE